jgi:hypothetical protein
VPADDVFDADEASGRIRGVLDEEHGGR